MVANKKATMTARSGPNTRTLSMQTAAIQNSDRRICHNSRNSSTSIRFNTALATTPANAAVGRYASSSVKNTMTKATVTAAAKLESCVRDPAASIAAVREALGPETNEPQNPPARLVMP